MTVAAATGLALVGHELEVPCSDGSSRPYVHLDHAASTPAIEAARAAADAILPWYASAHRGAGPKSRIATAAYEGARQAVAQLVGVRDEHDLVLVRNTTEGLNVLASALPPGSRILCTPVEHHANLLPWRRHDVRMLPFPRSADDLLALVEAALVATRIDVVAVTGASNVTGEVWPIAALARLAHAHGAELAVDAAQLAPHRPLDVTAAGIDYLALSGHKLYAPYGAGAHVLRRGGRAAGAPLLQGAARRTRSASRTSSGATRPRATRRARRTSSAPSRSARPATRSPRTASRRSPRRSASCSSGSRRASTRSPGCAACASGPSTTTASAWSRSRRAPPSRGGSRRASASSTRSACARARSARTRCSATSTASRRGRRGRTSTGPRPSPCGRASGSA